MHPYPDIRMHGTLKIGDCTNHGTSHWLKHVVFGRYFIQI